MIVHVLIIVAKYCRKIIANRFIGGGKAGNLSASQGAYLRRHAENRSREGGHPQGWKAQTRREMADEMAW